MASEDTKKAQDSDRKDSGEFTKGSQAAKEAGKKGGHGSSSSGSSSSGKSDKR